MEEPLFMKHLTAMVKMINFLDIRNKGLYKFKSWIRYLTLAFFFLSTTLCMNEKKFNDVTMSKLHDIIFFIVLSSIDGAMLTNRTAISSLIEFVSAPIASFEKNTVHSKIAKDHNKEVNMYCMLFFTIISTCVLLWNVITVVLLSATSNNVDEGCSHVLTGWVWNSDFYFCLLLLNAVCVGLFGKNHILCYTFLLCSVIRIKYKCRLLCASLDDINEFMCQSEEYLESNISTVQVHTDPTSSALSSSHDKEARKVQGTEINHIHSTNTPVQKYLKERKIKEQCALCFKDLVDQHLSIIELVNLTEKSFRHVIMFYMQFAVVMVALSIPKISLSEYLLKIEYINRVIEVVYIFALAGFYNYLGQIVLDESESICQALYNCDWTDKPPSFKKGLLIMQIVVNKPLKLTIGGIYTLSREFYTNFLGAAYSYTSFLQSEINNG